MRTPALEPTYPDAPRRPAQGWIVSGAVLILLPFGALVVTGSVIDRPEMALVLPALAVGAIACARWPAAATCGLIFVSGASGSLEAFLSAPTLTIRDFLLGGLWLGVIGAHLGGSERSPWIWPGLLGVAFYLGVTAVEGLTSPNSTNARFAFRVSALPMTALLLVGFAPWRPETITRIARGTIAIAIVVGAYAAYRKIAGPAASELEFARLNLRGLPDSEIRFFSSFPTAQHLALFCGSLIPFLAALALAWRGRWRLAAALAIPLLAVAVLASEVRTGTIAVAAGTAVTVLLFSLSGAFPSGRRIALAVAASGVALLIGIGAYEVTIAGDEQSATRFARVFSPTEDPSFQTRRRNWDLALEDAPEHPFGHGLGTVGSLTARSAPEALEFTDSTYITIAYEQGLVLLVLFGMAVLTVLAGLVWKGISIRDPKRSAYGVGAAGMLVTVLVFFYTGEYANQLQIVTPWLLIGLGVAEVTRPATRVPARAQLP